MILIIGGNKKEEGNEMEHEKICEKYYGFIYNLCFQKLKREDLAKDAAQTVILIYLQKKDSFDERVILSTWFMKTCQNVCFWFLKEQKKGKKFEPLTSASAVEQNTFPTLDQEENKKLKEKLNLALKEISPYHRGILMMLYYEKKTFSEIGKQFQKGENAIRKGRQVAENKLRKVLNQRYAGKFNRAIDASLFSLLSEIPFKPEMAFIKLKLYQPYATGVLKMVFIKKIILVTTCFFIAGAGGIGLTKVTFANDQDIVKTEIKEAKQKVVKDDNNQELLKRLEEPIIFDFTNTSFSDGIIKLRELAPNVIFLYDKNLFSKDILIGIKGNGIPLKKALNQILDKMNAEYKIINQAIYISVKNIETKTEPREAKKEDLIGGDKDKEFLKKLEQPVFFDFTNTGFKNGLEELAELTAISIVYDKKLFAKGGLDQDALIGIDSKGKGMPFKKALTQILDKVNAEYAIKDQAIYINAKKK